MSGGGGSSSNEFKPPSYTQQPWKDYVGNAQTLSGQPIDPYGGKTVADLTPMTGTGLQMLSTMAMHGTPERVAGGNAVVNAASGQMNPYASQANPYAGQNPYLSQMIDSSNSKITDQYKRGTAQQTDAQYARGGAYGGSGYQDAVSHNQQNLAGALSANTNNLLGQNYTQSANLAEQGLNRGMQGFQNSVGNSLNAAQIGQGQQGLDASAIQSMIAGGAIPQANNQQMLDANRNLYQQRQQSPFTLSDYLGSALSRASGGQGTQTYAGGGQSGLLGALGLGSIGYGLLPGSG